LRILVVGQNVRHIASSAARAGCVVFAADCYSDLDLAESVSQSFLLDCDPSIPGDLAKSAEHLIRRVLDRDSIDALVLGPGIEEMRIEGVEVLNNPPEKASFRLSSFHRAPRILPGGERPSARTALLTGGSL